MRPLSLVIGFLLDQCLGDPERLPHPVVWLGNAISSLEPRLRRGTAGKPSREYVAGIKLAVVVAGGSYLIARLVVEAAAALHPVVRMAVEGYICFQLLAAKGLKDASLAVYRRLAANDLPGARQALSMIVGRDTDRLDQDGVERAAVETVAENTSDAVIAPMFYFALGGAPLMVLYKAINTLDSMVGYKNDRYRWFGGFSARLDDVANFIPARLTGPLLVAAAWLRRYDWRSAWRILLRDRKNHTSPNAGHPEAACAGALGLRLGGSSVYGGLTARKPTIGDAVRPVEAEDIVKANRLLSAAAWLWLLLLCLAMKG